MTGISFIICASKLERANTCRASIDVSIGETLKHEFVVIDNRKGKYDIFSAYSKGASKANFPILAFVHDDVEFLSNSHWLADLRDLIDKKDTGIVGVAGSKDLTSSGRWWDDGNRLSGAAIHTDGNIDWPTAFGPFGRVAIVDGLLLFICQDVFEAIGGFDKSTLSGFHYYDVDLCARAHWAGYKNYTINIMVKHLSIGEMSPEWHAGRRQWLQAHQGDLPIRLA